MSDGKRVLLIISGGISAYKSLDLIRELKLKNIKVRCILTTAGSQFVTPLSLKTLTEDKIYQDLFSLTDTNEIGHIELSRDADLIVIAPATANIIAKMRAGIADDLATTALIATDKPVLIAPSMNVRMWEHPATQSNIIELDLDSNYNVKRYIYENFNGSQVQLTTEEVDHLVFYNPSYNGLKNKRGLSPLQAAYNSLKAANNRLEAQAHAYENRGATNIISSGTDLSIGSKERDSLQKNTDKILGGAKNFNKSIVTTANVRVTPLGMSPTDLKLIEAKELDLRDICNAFGVPSTLFNDQAASTLDNLKVGTKMMYNNAVIPNNDKLISSLNQSIVPAYSAFENKELRISQDLSGIDELQEDQLVKAQKSQTEITTLLSIADNISLTPEQKENLYKTLGYEL